MNRPSTISIAALLLLAAGGIVMLKRDAAPSVSEQGETTEEKNDSRKSRSPYGPGSGRKSAKSERSEPSKWSSLTDESIASHTRLQLAREIDLGLPEDDIDLFFAFLRHQPSKQNSGSWGEIMNEIMEQMRKKGVAADRLGPELLSLIKDPSQSELVRDYAVQHLSLWVAPPGKGMPSEPSAEVVSEALQTMASTITDPSIAETSIPGTALMALTMATRYLEPEVIDPIWEKLSPSMTAMIKGEVQAPISTKTMLIQSMAMRKSQEHLPLVQEMARDESMESSLRLSSIAALGIYQSATDKDYLTKIAEGKSRFRYAAAEALNKLSQ